MIEHGTSVNYCALAQWRIQLASPGEYAVLHARSIAFEPVLWNYSRLLLSRRLSGLS